MLKILHPDDPRDRDHLAQMHQLRYDRFVVEMGWQEGLQIVNQMEFDQYDNSSPLYLANIGINNRVNTIVRMLPANRPNYTFDTFCENAQMTGVAREPDVIELSCTCTDKHAAPANALPLLMMGLLELGLATRTQSYISTGSRHMQQIAKRLRWPPESLSVDVTFGTQHFAALRYPLSHEIHSNFKTFHGFKEPVLAPQEIERCIWPRFTPGM